MFLTLRTRLFIGAAAVAVAIAAHAATPADPGWLDDLAKWRARADTSLKRERGWLSIVTRDELTPGEYRIGSAPDNNVVLPKALAPAHLGTIIVSPGKARLVLAKGQQMRIVAKDDLGEEFTARDLVTGATNLEWVTAGRLSLQFVKREDGKIVVRAADRESPRRKTFAGRVWYEPRAEFKVPARFVPRAEGATIPIANVRGESPDELEYKGSAQPLRDVWMALRNNVRGILDDVTLADVIADRIPSGVKEMGKKPDLRAY